jgi:hypothetical protein
MYNLSALERHVEAIYCIGILFVLSFAVAKALLIIQARYFYIIDDLLHQNVTESALCI